MVKSIIAIVFDSKINNKNLLNKIVTIKVTMFSMISIIAFSDVVSMYIIILLDPRFFATLYKTNGIS